MQEGGVRQLALSDNVLAAHVHSGTSSAFYFTRFIFTLFYGGWSCWSVSFFSIAGQVM